jgi:EmrB/QacA subfamily drug resistance transporter
VPMFGGENHREKLIVLFTCCFALAMAMLDNTVVNVAIPTLIKDLHADASEVQWILDGYVLVFASLLLTGGTLGDRYGRKKMFLSGLAIFTFFSFMCGVSGSATELIIFRAFQGVGGALMMPGTLSILTVTFPPEERAKAIGLWAGVSGLALGIGPLLGGFLTQHASWHWVFFINVPVGIIALIIGSRTIRESRSDQERQLDIPGLILGTGGLFAITFGLIEANRKGWSSPEIITSLIIGAILIAVFLVWESRSKHPMMPLSYFRIPAFSAGNTVAFSVSLGLFSSFLYLSLYMQLIRGYSPTQAGLRFLPMTLMIIVTAPWAGRLAQKIGSRVPMTYGLILAGLGTMSLSRVQIDTPFWIISIVFIVMGHGLGATMAPMTAAVMNSVGPQRAGLGSAMTNTSREIGGVLGIAALGAILFSHVKSSIDLSHLGLTAAQQAALAAQASHGFVEPDKLAALGLTPAQVQGFVMAFDKAYMAGFHLVTLIGGAILLIAAVVANVFIPGRSAAHVEASPVEAGEAGETVAAHV